VTIKVAIIGHYTMDGGTWGIWNKKNMKQTVNRNVGYVIIKYAGAAVAHWSTTQLIILRSRVQIPQCWPQERETGK